MVMLKWVHICVCVCVCVCACVRVCVRGRGHVYRVETQGIITWYRIAICYTKSRFCGALSYLCCKKMCEACMLHSRVTMQALRWLVAIATQEKFK